MYTQEIKITQTGQLDEDSQLDLIYQLLGVWLKNGQILNNECPVSKEENAFSLFPATPDIDSLEEKYNNDYVKQAMTGLAEAGMSLQITPRGIVPESSPVCECSDHQAGYILYTHFMLIESPLRCFKCFGTVPLYKIPVPPAGEYYDILTWQDNYRACDQLQINCSVGEAFAVAQMSGVDSELTKEGQTIGQSLVQLGGEKVYYYLFNETTTDFEADATRSCPGCGQAWHTESVLHGLFNFVCHDCGLLSNEASFIEISD